MRSTQRECSLVPVRRAAVLAVVMIVAQATACSDESGSTGDVADALRYMPDEPALLFVVDTDVDGAQVQNFEDAAGETVLGDEDVESLLEQGASDVGLSYEDDVEPLLGGELVVAVEDESVFGGGGSPGFVAALPVDDEDKARDALDKIPEAKDIASVEGGVLLVAETPDALDEARARADDDEGLDQTTLDEALRGISEDALVRIYADLDDGLLRLSEFEPFTKIPLVDAVTTLGASVSFEGSEMHAEALLSTEGVSPEDMPVASGTADTPDIVRRDGWVSAANTDQSKATVFLLRAVRAAFPDSDFVRHVETVERERGIDFEQEFLRQFNGPSQSLMTPDGGFAARSVVSDPDRLAETMRKIYPDLGRLVEDLQGLESAGMALLLLFAPDAPAATSVLGSADVKVAPAAGDLYRMTGLEGPGPNQIVFGLIDDVFVVAEDESAAREIATAPAEPFDGPAGPAVAEAADSALAALDSTFGLGLEIISRARGSLEASPDGLRGSLEAELD